LIYVEVPGFRDDDLLADSESLANKLGQRTHCDPSDVPLASSFDEFLVRNPEMHGTSGAPRDRSMTRQC
jgi:hypothetical protein